jgi:hypothetical protein
MMPTPTAAPTTGNLSGLPADLPHGLLPAPPEVLDALAKESLRHPPEVFARAEEWLRNEWTLSWYFDQFGHEVLFRQTPTGPEVLAVGSEEIRASTNLNRAPCSCKESLRS